MTVSVIVPTAGSCDSRGPYIDRCLAGLAGTAEVAEVLVIVNREHGELGRRLREQYGVKVGWTEGPFSFPRAMNSGVEHARNELVLLLNDDVEAVPGTVWLAELEAALDAYPATGIAGATLRTANGKVQHAGMAVTDTGTPYHLLEDEPRVRVVAAVTGACVLTRRPLFLEVGGHDEGYQLCFSDVDYCLRAAAAGWKTVISPVTLTHHQWGTRGGPHAPTADVRLWYGRWARARLVVPEALERGNPL